MWGQEIDNMFGKILYYDKKTVDEYKALITGKNQVEVEEYSVSNGMGVGVDGKVFTADKNENKSYIARVKNSYLLECNEFEKMLNDRDDYYDFTEQNFDLWTVQTRSIIKINGYIEIPEAFDLFQLIDKFKPFAMNELNTKQMENKSMEMMAQLLDENTVNKKIPMVVDSNNELLLCSKINGNNLLSSYEEFDDYLYDEVTILARVASGVVAESKAFYDPLRDFIPLNRSMRRSANRSQELEPICVDGKYRLIDILGIYQ